MKKSDFFNLVKSLPAKPDYIAVVNASIFVCKNDEYMNKILTCKTLENAAKEMHKFNRWLAEALESIHPSETQWMPEEEKVTSVASEIVKIELFEENPEHKVMGLCGGKTQIINDMIDSGKLPSNVQSISRCIRLKQKKQKSPAKMFVRATLNILKQYDCFDSAKNSHWSSMTKKQKKHWARKFGIEMMECQAESYGMDLASDYKNDPISNILMSDNFNLSDIEFYLKHKDYWLKEGMSQLIAEMDYSSVEEYIEENLNCLW